MQETVQNGKYNGIARRGEKQNRIACPLSLIMRSMYYGHT